MMDDDVSYAWGAISTCPPHLCPHARRYTLCTSREIVGEAANPHYSFYCFPLYSVVPNCGMSKKLGVLLYNMETITFT
jgi:hypothetical protein